MEKSTGKAEDRDCRADTGRGGEGGTTQDGADPGRNSLKGFKPGSQNISTVEEGAEAAGGRTEEGRERASATTF